MVMAMAMARMRFMLLWLLAVMTAGAVEAAAADGPSSVEFYMHNPGLFTWIPNRPSAVEQLAMKALGSSTAAGQRSFKSRIITFDNVITAAADESSPVLGRAHGIRVVDKVDEGAPLAFTWLFNARFNTSLYSGTLSFQGTTLNFPSSEFSDVTVTGGTGTFRFARGYATFTNFYQADEISTLEGQHFQVFLRY